MNNRINLKNKLKNREIILAGWTSIGHPQISEMLALSSVDFIGIDIEHSTISQEQSQQIIAACHHNSVHCFPRVASHNQEAIRRLLDSGADGIIVPTVDTPKQVENLINYIKYPPIGKRGYGIARAQQYGHSFEEYTSKWNDSSSLIIQIESITAVENIESLLQFDEVDGAMIGPYDISGSMGIPGQIYHQKVKDAGKIVVEACQKFGKSCGTQDINPTSESLNAAIKSGYNFIVLSSDIFILWKWGQQMQKVIKGFR